MRKLLILCTAVLFAVACGKSDDKKNDNQTPPTAPVDDTANKPTEPPTEPPVAEEPEEEPLPTAADFEEQAATDITEKSLEKAVSDLEKELADVE